MSNLFLIKFQLFFEPSQNTGDNLCLNPLESNKFFVKPPPIRHVQKNLKYHCIQIFIKNSGKIRQYNLNFKGKSQYDLD